MRIGDLFTTGPTFTNVTDFRAIVVDRPVNSIADVKPAMQAARVFRSLRGERPDR